MNYYTPDLRVPSRIARIRAVKNDTLRDIAIHNDCFLLLYLISGSVSFAVGDEQFSATGPCFVGFDETDAPILTAADNPECYAIYFHPTFLNVNLTFTRIRSPEYMEIAREYDLFFCRFFLFHVRNIPVHFYETYHIAAICEKMRVDLETQPDGYWPCRARGYLIELILTMERLYSEAADDEATALKFSMEIQTAISYMEANFSNDLKFSDIVCASGLNRTTFADLFKKECGMTAFDYLMQHRIEVAKRQVTLTNLPLKEIAANCGFKTVQHFTRIFKEHTSETPARYRMRTVSKRINHFERGLH